MFLTLVVVQLQLFGFIASHSSTYHIHFHGNIFFVSLLLLQSFTETEQFLKTHQEQQASVCFSHTHHRKWTNHCWLAVPILLLTIRYRCLSWTMIKQSRGVCMTMFLDSVYPVSWNIVHRFCHIWIIWILQTVAGTIVKCFSITSGLPEACAPSSTVVKCFSVYHVWITWFLHTIQCPCKLFLCHTWMTHADSVQRCC